jgi:hypothetical protein
MSFCGQAFSATFSLLNVRQTYELMDAAFDASMVLIGVQFKASGQGRKDEAARYEQMDQLLEESVFNALTFGKSQGQQDGMSPLYAFATRRFSEMTLELGYGIGRYVRVSATDRAAAGHGGVFHQIELISVLVLDR